MGERGEESRDRSYDLLEEIPVERYQAAIPRVHFFIEKEMQPNIRRAYEDPDLDSLLYRVGFGPDYSGRAIAHLLRLVQVRPNERSIPLVSLAKYDPQTQRVVFRITTTVRDAFLKRDLPEISYLPTEIEEYAVEEEPTQESSIQGQQDHDWPPMIPPPPQAPPPLPGFPPIDPATPVSPPAPVTKTRIS